MYIAAVSQTAPLFNMGVSQNSLLNMLRCVKVRRNVLSSQSFEIVASQMQRLCVAPFA
jgi:hypothetical protein